MKAVGLIVEYNPFHNGHLYHVQQSRKQHGADCVIAVMSGSFLQRGEPAIVNKWSRAAMALHNGVDLVIELPYIYSTQHAEHFAFGAVSLLEAMKCDSFCFGSENGSISSFKQLYDIMAQYEEPLNELIRQYSKEGNSYPRAFSLALQSLNIKLENDIDLAMPNNILGFQYVRAGLANNYHIRPSLINRVAAHYHDSALPSGHIASATSIRKALMDEVAEDVQSFMPAFSWNELNEYAVKNNLLHSWEQYWPFLQYTLVSHSAEQLSQIYEVEEGIQHRLKEAALLSESFEQFMANVKTKRYTYTRIQRICIHILNNVSKQKMKQLMHKPSYIRILGFTDKGRQYLSEKKKQIELPIVTKPGSFTDEGLALDIHAATIHSLPLPYEQRRQVLQREYKQPIILKKACL
ncbi:nucleotidyltransferase [Bacillus sp. AGMB 02131]|uniref:tRNA(Met) cytidine acetate ligase n=1 Tax=Peribacillus faecalis TaxID=2772559 RepID=A0A927H9F7_9BACI|nr:nucleotidyltransferase [Peribacillus faecalis]MBD3106839.1 nucleotidyltransferase [Peribacillus faecalis]